MTKHEIGMLISRIFALFFLVQCISRTIVFPNFLTGDLYLSAFSFLMIIIPLGLFGIFWFKSNIIGSKIIQSAHNEKTDFPSYEVCMDISLVLFGFLLMSKAIPDIASLISYLTSDGMVEAPKLQGSMVLEYAVRILLYIACGLFMVLRAQSIAQILIKIKNIGIKNE